MLIIILRPKLGLLLTWLNYEYIICQKRHSGISSLKLSAWFIKILYVAILYNVLKKITFWTIFDFFHMEQLVQLFNSNTVFMPFLFLIDNWILFYIEWIEMIVYVGIWTKPTLTANFDLGLLSIMMSSLLQNTFGKNKTCLFF